MAPRITRRRRLYTSVVDGARSAVPIAALALALAIAAAGCESPSGSAPPSGAAATAAATGAAAAVTGPLIEWLPAPAGDVADIARREAERARRDGRALLVYVGASWCEPCKRFHEAAEAGQIRGLPPLRMLELDLDRDADRLAAAGYASKMIPLFAVPGPDGRGGSARIEGAVKGAGATGNIVPRLSALLARAGGS
jgi:thiol-disulfide isomerase/thioredoxin